jgi:WD40-like Beta Propeller Repeat
MKTLELAKQVHRSPLRRALLLIAPAFVIAAAPILATPAVEFGAWSEPINVGPPINTEYNDTYPILTADGLTIYFTSDRPGGLGGDDLWVSRRESTDAPWGEPENLTVLNGTSNDSLPMLSTSGNIMYFHSNRPGGCGNGDLWMSRAKPGGDAWTAPMNMGCVVNTAATEIAPAFYANDDLGVSTIYFGSNRPGSADFDIYETTTTDEDLESAVWGPGGAVPELSSPGRDTRTFVRRDGARSSLRRIGLAAWASISGLPRATTLHISGPPQSIPARLSTVLPMMDRLLCPETVEHFISSRPARVASAAETSGLP